MSRRSIIKDTEEELIKDAEVVMRWSKKRIVIATAVCLFLILGGLYTISLLGQNASKVLGTNTSDSPKLKLPDQNNIDDIIETAKKDLSNVNAKNIIQSQPKIQKIIDDLTHLTGSSSSAKSLICDTLCK
jgi:predicted PurR-regulated permease PerM